MARLRLAVTSGEVTLSASTAKSVLQVKAPTNQRIVITGLKFLGKQAAGGTDAAVKVRMTRSTTSFGTFSGATVGKLNPSNGETAQGTYGANATVEPLTPTDGGLLWEFNPQGGIIEALPPNGEIEVPGGQSVQFEMTSTGTPTVVATCNAEE